MTNPETARLADRKIEMPDPVTSGDLRSLNLSVSKKRELSSEERELILTEIVNGITLGEAAPELKRRQRNLAEVLDCSLVQVKSIGAHLKIRADKALTRAGLMGVLDRMSLIAIAEQARLFSGELFAEIVGEEATQRSVEAEKLRIAVEFYLKISGSNPRDPARQLLSESAELENSRHDRPLDPGPTASIEISPGALADYDNPAKVQWRQALFDFIRTNLSPAHLRGGYVVCMPSIKCAREIQGYLDLGVPADHIIAVEREGGIADQFKANVEAMGAQPWIGTVEGLLAKYTLPITVASLDFVGPLCSSYLDAIRHIVPPIDHDAVVAVNVMGRRESAKTQSLLRELAAIQGFAGQLGNLCLADLASDDLLNSGGDLETFAPRMLKLRERSAASIAEAKGHVSTLPFGEVRDTSLSSLIFYSLSEARRGSVAIWDIERILRTNEERAFRRSSACKSWDEMSPAERNQVLGASCTYAAFALRECLSRYRLSKGQPMFQPQDAMLLGMAATGGPVVKKLEEYDYISGVGSSSTPFSSTFLHLTGLRSALSGAVPLLALFNSFARQYLLGPRAVYGYARVGHNVVPPGGSLRSSSVLRFVDQESRKLLGKVQAESLFEVTKRVRAAADWKIYEKLSSGTRK